MAASKLADPKGRTVDEQAVDIWTTAYKTIGDAKAAGRFGDRDKLILDSDGFQELMHELDSIAAELQRVVDVEIRSLKSTKWAFWSGGAAQAAAIASGSVCLEGTSFGRLFDKLSIHGGKYDMQLWGSLSLAYTKKAVEEADDFRFHAFIGEGALDSGVFAKIEMATFKSLTGAKYPYGVPMTFWAVAPKGQGNQWNEIAADENAGESGTYEVLYSRSSNSSRAMHTMADTAKTKNQARSVRPPWETK